MWAERFSMKSLKPCSKTGYQQPVFSHLNEPQRKALVEKRKTNCGPNIGRMLSLLVLLNSLIFERECGQGFAAIFLFSW